MFKRLHTLCAAALLNAAVLPGVASGQGPDQKALAVATRSDVSDNGFTSSIAHLTMILRNAQGQETVRVLEIRTLEREDAGVGDKSILLLSAPGDVKGTAFLSYAKLVEPDDQWIFLPALKRVKRIASVNKSGPFLGSEFAYEDFTSQEVGKYLYRYLKEEACGDFICDVIERTPLYEYSGYSKQVVWIDQTHAQFRQIAFYDRAGVRVKTLNLEDYRLYQDRFWRAHRLEMSNLRNGKSTTLLFKSFAFGEGLNKRGFTKGALSRLR